MGTAREASAITPVSALFTTSAASLSTPAIRGKLVHIHQAVETPRQSGLAAFHKNVLALVGYFV